VAGEDSFGGRIRTDDHVNYIQSVKKAIIPCLLSGGKSIISCTAKTAAQLTATGIYVKPLSLTERTGDMPSLEFFLENKGSPFR
jgi:hypothetical protein